MDKHSISEARKQLGEHNDDNQPIEWCAQNLRLDCERFKKHLIQANEELAAKDIQIDAMRKVIHKYKTTCTK